MILNLKLLGTPTADEDGQPIEGFISVKSRALLFYLAMKPGTHGRQTLAALLWPETSESAAAKNLRNVLSNLRKLAGSHLQITRRTVSFQRDSAYRLDVEQFSALLERYRASPEEIALLEEAVALYGGDFLQGFDVPDSESFEAWLIAEREELQQAQEEILRILAVRHGARSDFKKGMDYVSRLLALNPYSESGQRLKMSLLAQHGRRNEALAAYAEFQKLLEEALGVQPTMETRRLYDQIKAGNFKTGPPGSETGHKPADLAAQTVDWGDIPAEFPFYGRQDQLQQLQQWLAEKISGVEGPRLIFITGMGGVGKTALAARLTRRLAQSPQVFDCIIWRSLINAPPLTAVLRVWLMALSAQQLVGIPDNVDDQISLLLTYLRDQRCLLILDNFESVLQADLLTGRYRSGMEAYGQLIQRVGGGQHKSHLLITSRELPRGLSRIMPGPAQPVILKLPGLPDEAGTNLLRVRGIGGSNEELAQVVRRYSGNPLALKLAADTARQLFGGDVGKLLDESAVFGDIYDVLDEQFGRLTALEMEILTWLAIEREPLSPQKLRHNLAIKPHQRQFLEALQSLYHRSLLEQASGGSKSDTKGEPRYTLQNVVMEYVGGRLIESICREIESGELDLLKQFALLKAQAREFIQGSQRRLLLGPVAQWMANRFGKAHAVQKLHHLLENLRNEPSPQPGYAGANILHLLVALGEDLKGDDFSYLSIWQADLRDVILHEVSFKGSDLSGSIFREPFGLVLAVAFSPDGQFLAAATADGSITLWRLNEYQPNLVIERPGGYDTSIAFSPDGKILAAAGIGGAIFLWDVFSGKLSGRLLSPASEVTSIIFSPDGKTLYSSDLEQRIRVWDVASGQIQGQIDTADNQILTLAVSSDGKLLAGGGLDGLIYLWEAESGKLIRRLGDGGVKIHAVAFSPDDALLAAAAEDNNIHLWHVSRGESAGSLSGHADFVLALYFHPNGTNLASGSADQTVRLWHVIQRRKVRVLHGSANWVTSVAYSPDGRLLASGGYERKVHLWQSDNGLLLHTMRGSLAMINALTFSPDGRMLAGASYDRPVQLWDTRDGSVLHTLHGHKGSMRKLVFSPDGRSLAVSGDEAAIRLWNTQSGQLQRELTVERKLVRTLAFSPDGRFLAAGVGSGYGTLVVWHAATGKRYFRLPDVRTGLDHHFCFSPDGTLIAYSDHDHDIKLLKLDDQTVHAVLSNHQAPIETIRFSADGSLIASLDRNCGLIVWQITADKSVQKRSHFQGRAANADLWNLAFSPDNRLIAFQLDDDHLGLFDAVEGRLLCSIESSLYGVGNLAFSRDGKFLISGNIDGQVNLWLMPDGRHYQTLLGHEGTVMSMAVDPVDSLVASGDDRGSIRIWDIQTGTSERVLVQPGPYKGLDISGANGLSQAQVAALKALGAVTN